MIPDKSTILSRQRGTLPDRYWYQLNGRSAMENYAEQRQAAQSKIVRLIIKSEVKVK